MKCKGETIHPSVVGYLPTVDWNDALFYTFVALIPATSLGQRKDEWN
jgi:hypothetical protein